MSCELNVGELNVAAENTEKLVDLMRQYGLITGSRKPDILQEPGGFASVQIQEIYGDIEDDLENIADELKNLNISLYGVISWYDDANGQDGRYEIEENHVTVLCQEDIAIRDADDDALVSELVRRGYNVMRPGSGNTRPAIYISTPAGQIKSEISPDTEYPGIWTTFEDPDGSEPGIILEYTPSEYDAEMVRHKCVMLRVYSKDDPNGDPAAVFRMSDDIQESGTE